jgi:hypothetical protein
VKSLTGNIMIVWSEDGLFLGEGFALYSLYGISNRLSIIDE